MVPVIIGNTQRENQCLSSWSLISRHCMMVDFSFFQTGLIRKLLEATGMEHWYGLPTPTKVEVPLGTYVNGYEANRVCSKSYTYVIGMILYLASNTRPDISFDVY